MDPVTEHGWFRGEGGGIWRMDLPLPEIMAEKVTKGYLQRVNEDGTPYVDATAEPTSGGDGEAPTEDVPRPAQSAPKAEWVGYAVRAGGMTPDDAEALTKHDLIDRFGRDGG
jgi:hypothetical protein